jgi:hypothetical protein
MKANYKEVSQIIVKMGKQLSSSPLFIDCNRPYGSLWREVLCNIVIDFGLKLVRVIIACLNEHIRGLYLLLGMV